MVNPQFLVENAMSMDARPSIPVPNIYETKNQDTFVEIAMQKDKQKRIVQHKGHAILVIQIKPQDGFVTRQE